MGQRQAAKLEVFDPAAGDRVALDHHQSIQPRRDDHARFGPLAWHRHIGQLAGRTIEIPTPRLAESLADVVDEQSFALGKDPGVVGHLRHPGEHDDVLGRVDRFDAEPHGGPSAKDLDLQVSAVASSLLRRSSPA